MSHGMLNIRWFLDYLSGYLGVHLTQEQVNYVVKALVGKVTPRFCFGELDQAIDALRNIVFDLALKSSDYAIPMIHDGVGNLDDRRQIAGLGVFQPGFQEGSTLMAILDREDVLKGQAELVGLRRLEVLVFE